MGYATIRTCSHMIRAGTNFPLSSCHDGMECLLVSYQGNEGIASQSFKLSYHPLLGGVNILYIYVKLHKILLSCISLASVTFWHPDLAFKNDRLMTTISDQSECLIAQHLTIMWAQIYLVILLISLHLTPTILIRFTALDFYFTVISDMSENLLITGLLCNFMDIWNWQFCYLFCW